MLQTAALTPSRTTIPPISHFVKPGITPENRNTVKVIGVFWLKVVTKNAGHIYMRISLEAQVFPIIDVIGSTWRESFSSKNKIFHSLFELNLRHWWYKILNYECQSKK